MSEEYKITFNRLLSHKVIPHMFFSLMDDIYEDIVAGTQKTQIFMQNSMQAAIDLAKKYPEIEPAFPVEYFKINMVGDSMETGVIVVNIPNCKNIADCFQIAFPRKREQARYFTCELTTSHLTGKPFFIMGEWKPDEKSYSHHNYGQIDLDEKSFAARVIKMVYNVDAEELLDAQDEEHGHYEKVNAFAVAGAICYDNGRLENALEYFNRIMEIEDGEALYFHYRSGIHRAMGNECAADYDLFRAKLIDMIYTTENTGEKEDELGMERRKPLIETEEQCDISRRNMTGKLTFRIKKREGEVRLPELFFAGGENALLRLRLDQYLLLNKIHEDVRKVLDKTDEVTVTEYDSYSKETDADNEIIREYTVPVRHISYTGCLDSTDDIRKCGYPLFASLASLVRANGDRPIREIIAKDDLPNLAAVLAAEEDYPLLNIYIAQGLPLNERLGWWFRDWQPAPLFYITTYELLSCMKEPAKMLRWLTEHGADPNLASIEGDTPLGNQCMTRGTAKIMKTLLDIGADPNLNTILDGIVYKPLLLQLIPEEYDTESHAFLPLTAVALEKAKLLINAGANVNAVVKFEASEVTPLGLAITYSAGTARAEIVTLLINKGADLREALDCMENHANMESSGECDWPEYCFALYEFYTGFPDLKIPTPYMTAWKNHEKAQRYLKLSANSGYGPAKAVMR
ncbi:MAG: hypothetical protein LBH05_05045 [Deferribacteraceae bacterium]|jgi:tetratricopeptide (TPR) repeat protein|nr:hypothetical protein [Deferribacteraceae bacterium]